MTQCQMCGGIYNATLADGLRYFHQCPPLSAAEVQKAVVAGQLVLPVGETPDVAVTRRTYTRVNARDENVKGGTALDASAPRAVGTGVLTVPDPAPPPVPVLTK